MFKINKTYRHLLKCLPALCPQYKLYIILSFIGRNSTDTILFFIPGVMIYRDGDQIISGETESCRREGNYESLTITPGREQNDRTVFTHITGLPSL